MANRQSELFTGAKGFCGGTLRPDSGVRGIAPGGGTTCSPTMDGVALTGADLHSVLRSGDDYASVWRRSETSPLCAFTAFLIGCGSLRGSCQ